MGQGRAGPDRDGALGEDAGGEGGQRHQRRQQQRAQPQGLPRRRAARVAEGEVAALGDLGQLGAQEGPGAKPHLATLHLHGALPQVEHHAVPLALLAPEQTPKQQTLSWAGLGGTL